MSDEHDGLIPVNDWSEVPAFASEREEADFWGTHCLGQPLLDQMRPLDDADLPRPRRRRRTECPPTSKSAR